MNTKDNALFIQMVPNSFVDVFASGIESIEITTNVFTDIEVVKDGPCIKVNIVGFPKVKQIIYGQ